MPPNRFYAPDTLEEGRQIYLCDREAHHLHVMRIAPGQMVELIDGKGTLATAELLHLKRHEAHLKIQSCHVEEKSSKRIILAQALPRMNHLEWLIEKGTELGTDAFWLFPGHLSDKTALSPSQEERLSHLICAAAKQCGRLHFPTLEIKSPVEKWSQPAIALIYGTLEENTPFLWNIPLESPLILCMGPEAGFSKEELSCLKGRLQGQGVRLSPHTLRSETAAIVALSLLQITYK